MNLSFATGTLGLAGQTALRSRGSLRVSKARDLLVVRSIRGAYNLDGGIARDTLRLWGKGDDPPDLVPDRLLNQDIVCTCEREVVWGGCLSGHYGHFLTEDVSRLWPLLPGAELEGLPVVFTSPGGWSFALDWLKAFGVRVVDLPKRGAVRFTRMFVPEPAWRIDAWVAPEMRDIHLHARRALNVPSSRQHNALWLSRSALDRDRVAYDEGLLEWLLAEHVAIVKPETMKLAEQVAAIEASNVVAGVVGSAFHTMLMTAAPPNCLYLCPPRVASTFATQDQLSNGDGTFVQALTAVPKKRHRETRFPGAYRLLIPETLRALSATALPTLLEDPRIAALAFPERRWSKVGNPPRERDIETAVASVLLNPLPIDPPAIGARMNLGAIFEAEGLAHCALEQFITVADLADNYAYGPLRAARLLARIGRRDEASAMAKCVLSIDPDSQEAANYLIDA